MGYINLSTTDGRKYIAPQEPQAEIIRWSFEQLAKNCFSIEDVRKMANKKGLRCSRSNFWKLLRNPAYCGFVRVAYESSETELINGAHEPIVSVRLFEDVQEVINTKRKFVGKTREIKEVFVLKGYLVCPVCSRKLRASFSQGRHGKKYPYYHCSVGCKVRFRAEPVNDSYEAQLRRLELSEPCAKLFGMILKDANVNTQRLKYLQERSRLQLLIEDQDMMIAKALKLFISDRLDFTDFKMLKADYIRISETLKKEYEEINVKLRYSETQIEKGYSSAFILSTFRDMDIADKKHIVHLIPPINFDPFNGSVSLDIGSTFSKILSYSNR